MSDFSLYPNVPAGFRFFSLGRTSRLVLAGGLWAIGVAFQLAVSLFLGTLFILAGWIPLFLRRVSNRPKDQGLEDWRAVSPVEVNRLLDTFSKARKMRRKLGSRSAFRVLSIVVGGVSLLFLLTVLRGEPAVALVVGDTALFLVPALFFGRVRVFVPQLINQKLVCFQALLKEPVPEGFLLTPYLRFDKDEEGRDVPEDLRFLLEKKRKNDDLVGVQFQITINKGPNGSVPYMYSVVLTRGRKGQVYKTLRGVAVRGFEVEEGGDEEYGTVVIRQRTSGGGYQTTPEQCRRLFEVIMEILHARRF